MDLPKRILIKACSTRPYQWVMRKIMMAMMRRAAKAPEVQDRIKALQAAVPDDRFYAHLEYGVAVHKELAKSKWVKAGPVPPAIHLMRIEGLVHRFEHSNAIAGEVENFRRWAGEVLGNWNPQYPPELKERIEDALSRLVRP